MHLIFCYRTKKNAIYHKSAPRYSLRPSDFDPNPSTTAYTTYPERSYMSDRIKNLPLEQTLFCPSCHDCWVQPQLEDRTDLGVIDLLIFRWSPGRNHSAPTVFRKLHQSRCEAQTLYAEGEDNSGADCYIVELTALKFFILHESLNCSNSVKNSVFGK